VAANVKAETARVKAEEEAEVARVAAEEAEQQRIADEEAEALRLAADAEAVRLAADEQAEQARVAAAEEENVAVRLAAEEAAGAVRIAEQEAEAAQLAAEEVAAQARKDILRRKISSLKNKITTLQISNTLNEEILEIRNGIDEIKEDPLSQEIKGGDLNEPLINITQETFESKKEELKKIMITDIQERIDKLNVSSPTSPNYQKILTDITTNILLDNGDTNRLQQNLRDKYNEIADMDEFNKIKQRLKKFFVIDEEVQYSSRGRGEEFKNTSFDKPYDSDVIVNIINRIKNTTNDEEREKTIFLSMIKEIKENQEDLKNLRKDKDKSQKVENEVVGLFKKVVEVKNNIKIEMNSDDEFRKSMAFLNLSAGNDSRKLAGGLRTQIFELEKRYKKPEVLGLKLSLIKKLPEVTEKLKDEDKYALINEINEKLNNLKYSYEKTELDKEAFEWVEKAEQERTEAGKNKKGKQTSRSPQATRPASIRTKKKRNRI